MAGNRTDTHRLGAVHRLGGGRVRRPPLAGVARRVVRAGLRARRVALGAGIAMVPSIVLHVWVAPMLVTFCVILPMTGMSEHYGCALGGEVFDTTRSVVSNRAFRFLVWNNNFHVVHHLVPAVPFHHA